MLNRRDFLRSGLLGSLILTAPGRVLAAPPPTTPRSRESRRARNVIFLVSDGMSLGTLTMAERYRRRHEGQGTHWLSLYSRPDIHRALMDTASASSLVTDSAAASSAWGCGHKVKNGSINHTPDGRPQTPIMHWAKSAGLRTGLVTTATITHATPAGFAAQATSRTDEPEIACQYLDAHVDLLLGGGRKFFSADTRQDRQDLFSQYARSGYAIVSDRDALAKTTGSGPLLGLFADGHLPYTLDHRADTVLTKTIPSLAEMTRSALARLGGGDRGFLLQVEGARVDHAAHGNDIGALIFDQLAFDDAVGVALEFASGRDDTLVIVTSDHGNANPGLNGTGGSFNSRGGSYGDTDTCFDTLAQFRRTNVWVLEGLSGESSVAEIQARVNEATALSFASDEIDILRHALRKEHREGYRVRNAPLIALGQILSNYTSVGWTGTQHTTDFTELVAFGPGSENIHGLVQNTILFETMSQALGLEAALQSLRS